jgi:hypothetical protein
VPILTILKAIWGFRSYWPYLVILILGGALKFEHSRLLSSRAETAATATQLRTAVDANQADLATISALQTSLKDVTKNLADAKTDGERAVQQAAQTSRELQQRLAAAVAGINKGNPSDDAFLALDINATHPDIARSLRDADSNR